MELYFLYVFGCVLVAPCHVGFLAPRPEIKPVSPALEGRFLTTGPAGKSQELHFYEEREHCDF